jgi:hypothetical protein
MSIRPSKQTTTQMKFYACTHEVGTIAAARFALPVWPIPAHPAVIPALSFDGRIGSERSDPMIPVDEQFISSRIGLEDPTIAPTVNLFSTFIRLLHFFLLMTSSLF